MTAPRKFERRLHLAGHGSPTPAERRPASDRAPEEEIILSKADLDHVYDTFLPEPSARDALHRGETLEPVVRADVPVAREAVTREAVDHESDGTAIESLQESALGEIVGRLRSLRDATAVRPGRIASIAGHATRLIWGVVRLTALAVSAAIAAALLLIVGAKLYELVTVWPTPVVIERLPVPEAPRASSDSRRPVAPRSDAPTSVRPSSRPPRPSNSRSAGVTVPPSSMPAIPAPAPEVSTAVSPEPPPLPGPEMDSILAVLHRYRQAYAALDSSAVLAVWPTADRGALIRALDFIREQHLEFDSCAITVEVNRAVANCGGSVRYMPKIGAQSLRTQPREWKFTLRRTGNDWLIDSVASR